MKTLFIAILVFVLSGPAFADDSELRYNALEDSWSYEDPENELKYNVLENSWSYEDPESHLKYNPLENRWEYAR